jgi:hypothetical protein
MKKTKSSNRPSIYQSVTDRIISSLKAGVIPWEKPWKAPRFGGGPFPRNFHTGKPYRGINVLLLWSSDYSSPFWLTFEQAQELKGHVRKGETGTPIVFSKQLPEDTKTDENKNEDDRAPFPLCHYTVFNVEQCDGLSLPEMEQPSAEPVVDEDELCEGIVEGAQRDHESRRIADLSQNCPGTYVVWPESATCFGTHGPDKGARHCERRGVPQLVYGARHKLPIKAEILDVISRKPGDSMSVIIQERIAANPR